MELKKNKAPHLQVCKMSCDNGLHKKLNNYELTKFMNSHSTNMFIGPPGSGKTSLAFSFFKSKELFNKVFENLYLFQPSHSRSSMEDNIFDSIEHKYDELTFDNLKEVMNDIKEQDSKYRNCIIFDDMGAYLKNKEVNKLMRELIFNRRHLKTSVFFLCQTYLSIDLDIRKLFSNLFIFRVSKRELELIFDEVIEKSKDYMLPISKLVFDKKYNFLFVNTETGRLFRNWDEIIL